MGIKDFYKFLKNNGISGNVMNEDKFRDTNVLVDTSVYINKFVQVYRATNLSDMVSSDGTIITHIFSFIYYTTNLMKKGQRPIYIFDGTKNFHLNKIVSIEREAAKNNAAMKLSTLTPTDKGYKTAFQQSFRVENRMIELLKELFDIMNIDYIVASGEADPLCSVLIMKGYASTIYTEDSDMLVYGANSLMRIDKRTNIEFDRNEILNKLNINNEEFISICIAAGCDYCKSIDKVAIATLYKHIINMRKIEPVNNIRQIIDYYKNNSNKEITEEIETNMINAFDFFLSVNKNPDPILLECDLSHTRLNIDGTISNNTNAIDKNRFREFLTTINSHQKIHLDHTINNMITNFINEYNKFYNITVEENEFDMFQ